MNDTITLPREVAEQALEALESCNDGDYSTGHVIHPSFNEKDVNAAITAIRTAIEQAKKVEPVAWKPSESATEQLWEALGRWSAYIASNGCKAELAPPQYMLDAMDAFTTPQPTERQEPVATVCYSSLHGLSIENHAPDILEAGMKLYTTPQPAIPAGYALVPVEPIKTADPEISREHLVAIAEKCGLLGAYRTREVVDAIVGYGQVILRDKAVQEAMYRASLAVSPKKGDADV